MLPGAPERLRDVFYGPSGRLFLEPGLSFWSSPMNFTGRTGIGWGPAAILYHDVVC